jgi:hypothetical protein
VAHDPDLDRDLTLITNVPIRTVEDAKTVYTQWRYRPRIEHTYRFDQMVLWLRRLGGKLGLSSDRDGVYILLAGIRAVFVSAATLAFASQHTFPR